MNLPPDLADVWEMRPKLRHDVVFLDAPTGAYLRGADTAFVLKGRSAFRWLSTLSPYLNGEHTVAQMCGGLDLGQQRTVATLIRALTARGFAKDAGDRSETPAAVGRRFASQIEFIDHFADDASGRFLRFRNSRIALGGSGPTLLAAAIGLLSNGCAQLDVHPEDGAEPYRTALRAEVDELRADGVPAEVRISTDPLDPAKADAVIYCAEPAQLPQVLALVRRAHTEGPLLVPVVWDNGRAILGPTAGAGHTPCWLCAQLRLTASAEPSAAAETWRHLAIGPVGGEPVGVDEISARMVGNAAAFELFRELTGALPPDTASSVVVLDGATLESSRERVLRHPECPVCRHTAERAAEPMPAPATEEEVYQRAELLVSPNAGVFTRFVDDPLEQAPLKTARLRVPAVGGSRELTAFDVDTLMGARLGAYRLAVRDYLGRLADPDGAVLGSAAELAAAGRQAVPWTALATASGAVPFDPERRLSWLPARVLGGTETVWVPTALALPFSTANRDGHAERTVAGAAVGASTDEVIADGLASALAYLALVDAIRGHARPVAVPEAELIADDNTALAIKAAHRFGRTPRAFTLAGPAPVHAVLAVSDAADGDRPIWAVGAARSAREARLAAVRDLVGMIQVRHFERIDADLGDPLLSDFDPRTALPPMDDPAIGAPTIEATDSSTEGILATLAGQGFTGLLVDHTTPDIRATQALVAGVVLLWRRNQAPEGTPPQ